jgi:hypothetical protein
MKSIITEIFCFVDEFCKIFESELQKKMIANKRYRKRPTRISSATLSEILTILILYSLSPCKNFKFYYLTCVTKEDFPNKLSYQRFVYLIPRALQPMSILIKAMKGEENGEYFIDATSLAICGLKRTSANKVFKGFAEIGKTTKGWFFGFKLHLIINTKGEIMNIVMTKAATNDVTQMELLAKNLIGKLYGDKGYISQKLAEKLLSRGLCLITGIRSKMKNKLMLTKDKIMLKKRSLIETVFDYLKNKFNLEHTRHRSMVNCFVHILATLLAYQFKKSKPKISDITTENYTLSLI